MNEPVWIAEARRHIGEAEIPGPAENPWIVSLWQKIKRGGIKTESVPWCAAFVGACLETVGLTSSRFESAASYLQWGVKLDTAEVGCIAVFERVGGGHVGFVIGRDLAGNLMVLGGNQGDAVNIRAISTQRVAPNGYRWPAAVPRPLPQPLPLIAGTSQQSTNEA